jgi:peptidoglycan hydrolase-like protein with peptidoglycan-binding domain
MRHPSPLFNTRPAAATSVVPVTTMPIIVGENPLQPLPEAPQPAPRVQSSTSQQAQAPAQTPAQTQNPVSVQSAAVPDTAAPQPQSSPAQIPPLANLSTQLTERVQQALRDRGFYTGAVDGIAGPATTEAVRAFEQRLGVAATGDINDRVLALLRSERGRQIAARQSAPQAVQPPKPVPATVAPPRPVTQLMPAPVPPEPLTASVEGRLQKVQRALNVAGYGMLRTDGRLDDKTTEAIRKFEAEHGMPVTGHITDRLMSMLVVRSAEAR